MSSNAPFRHIIWSSCKMWSQQRKYVIGQLEWYMISATTVVKRNIFFYSICIFSRQTDLSTRLLLLWAIYYDSIIIVRDTTLGIQRGVSWTLALLHFNRAEDGELIFYSCFRGDARRDPASCRVLMCPWSNAFGQVQQRYPKPWGRPLAGLAQGAVPLGWPHPPPPLPIPPHPTPVPLLSPGGAPEIAYSVAYASRSADIFIIWCLLTGSHVLTGQCYGHHVEACRCKKINK